jgi:hypothetical protein
MRGSRISRHLAADLRYHQSLCASLCKAESTGALPGRCLLLDVPRSLATDHLDTGTARQRCAPGGGEVLHRTECDGLHNPLDVLRLCAFDRGRSAPQRAVLPESAAPLGGLASPATGCRMTSRSSGHARHRGRVSPSGARRVSCCSACSRDTRKIHLLVSGREAPYSHPSVAIIGPCSTCQIEATAWGCSYCIAPPAPPRPSTLLSTYTGWNVRHPIQEAHKPRPDQH